MNTENKRSRGEAFRRVEIAITLEELLAVKPIVFPRFKGRAC